MAVGDELPESDEQIIIIIIITISIIIAIAVVIGLIHASDT